MNRPCGKNKTKVVYASCKLIMSIFLSCFMCSQGPQGRWDIIFPFAFLSFGVFSHQTNFCPTCLGQFNALQLISREGNGMFLYIILIFFGPTS